MRKIFSIFYMLALPVLSFAQAPDSLWSTHFGGLNEEWCYSVQQTSDKGYILAGYTESFGAASRNFWLVKTNQTGDSLWSRTFWDGDDNICYTVRRTSDSGYVLAGATTGNGYYEFYLVKTDSIGTEMWHQTFDRFGNADVSFDVQQTNDDGYVMAGHARHVSGQDDFWIVKTGMNGDSLWSRTYGGSSDEKCYSIQQTSDSGYIMAGWTESFGAGGMDIWLVRVDSLGTLLWDTTFGGGSDDDCWLAQQTTDGGYILVGWTESFGAGGADFWLLKTNSVGALLWNNTYGNSCDQKCFSAQQTSDGGYILAGYTECVGAGSADFWLVKTDSNGTKMWDITFGGINWDECRSVQQTLEGGYILGGFTSSFAVGDYDFWLVPSNRRLEC